MQRDARREPDLTRSAFASPPVDQCIKPLHQLPPDLHRRANLQMPIVPRGNRRKNRGATRLACCVQPSVSIEPEVRQLSFEAQRQRFCHPKFDLTTFDHSQTGYKLEGKHAGLKCSRCHLPSRISVRERATIKVKDLNKTYLGVSPDCTNCHLDSHQGRLGSNCLQCHNFTAWKEVRKVDHSRTRYPLSGLHAEVACRSCHTPGPDQQPISRDSPSATAMIAMPIRIAGGYSESCQSCHRTSGWKAIAATEMDRTFDHSRTKYPLLGKHSSVECDRLPRARRLQEAAGFQKCSGLPSARIRCGTVPNRRRWK